MNWKGLFLGKKSTAIGALFLVLIGNRAHAALINYDWSPDATVTLGTSIDQGVPGGVDHLSGSFTWDTVTHSVVDGANTIVTGPILPGIYTTQHVVFDDTSIALSVGDVFSNEFYMTFAGSLD